MNQLGIIGLGTMGANLARNAARNGAKVALYNRTQEKTEAFIKEFGSEGAFVPCATLQDLITALTPPRPLLLMVKAGDVVDDLLDQLLPLMDEGDIIVDAGNSHFFDTEKRVERLSDAGVMFLGMGVSGGEEGALHGPSMMPGGDVEAWDVLAPLFTAMAADDGIGGKCVTYIGPGGSGHFVKTVHNGIEYGDMQLIAEAYHLLSYLQPGLCNDELSTLFAQWNTGDDLQSYLIEITSSIFSKKDDLTPDHHGKDLLRADSGFLIDAIKDSAQQKGTGKWTTQIALDVGVPVPTITAAVDARILSSYKEERVVAHSQTKGMKVETPSIDPEDVRKALYLSKIVSYAQGLMLIQRTGEEVGWDLNLAEICRIWRGGCIIRSSLLGVFTRVFTDTPTLRNLLLDTEIMQSFRDHHTVWRSVVQKGIAAGVPLPAMSASLAYFDSYFSPDLPQNLTQAQRDFFGAHGYERLDREGAFHSQWIS